MIYMIKVLYSFFIPPGVFITALAGLALWLRRRHARAAVCVAIVALAMYIGATNYFGGLAVRSLENRYGMPEIIDADVIVVLGGGATLGTPDIDGSGGLTGSAANRLLTAVRLYHIHKAPVIFSGGQVFRDTGNEAHIAARLLESLGVSAQDIIVEDKSMNTTENARYVKEILDTKGFRSPALITSAFHMERSVLNFKKAGVEVIPVPADYQVSRQTGVYLNNFVPSGNGMYLSALAAKEYLGIMALGKD